MTAGLILHDLMKHEQWDMAAELIDHLEFAPLVFGLKISLAEHLLEAEQVENARTLVDEAAAIVPKLDAYRGQGMTATFLWAGAYGRLAWLYGQLGDEQKWQQNFELAIERLATMKPDLDQYAGYAMLTMACVENDRMAPLHEHVMAQESAISRWFRAMGIAKLLDNIAERDRKKTKETCEPT